MFRSTLILTSIWVICLTAANVELNEKNQEKIFLSPIETFPRQKSYQFNCSRTAVPFLEAWRRCLDNGAQFATIESPAEDQLFFQGLSKLVTVQAWIGATDLGRPGSFVWLDNSRPLVNNWDNFVVPWASGHPATVGGGCVYASIEINHQARWRSVPCDSMFNGCYACQTISYGKQ